MLVDPIEWNDGLNTGVEIIDTAHQQLFTVVYRISSLLKENNFEKSLLPVSKLLSF